MRVKPTTFVPVTVPAAVEYLLTSQLLHRDARRPLYLPATQSVHADDAIVDAEPAEQFWHVVCDVAAIALDEVPALQFEHAEEKPTSASE